MKIDSPSLPKQTRNRSEQGSSTSSESTTAVLARISNLPHLGPHRSGVLRRALGWNLISTKGRACVALCAFLAPASIGACTADRDYSELGAGGAGLGGSTSATGGSSGGNEHPPMGGMSMGGETGLDPAESCDLSLNEVINCGACGHICPNPGNEDEIAVCSDGECTTRCVEETTRCDLDAPVVLRCKDGAFQYDQACDSICVEGQCDGTCKPGDTACSNATVTTCSSSGTWEVGQSCPFVCADGACTGICKTDDLRCGSEGSEVCTDKGQWKLDQKCSFVCAQGACTGVCEPSDARCSDNDQEVCDETGQWTFAKECTYVCESGACTGVCSPGTYRCNAGGRQVCSEVGQWTANPCPSGTTCDDAICLKNDGQSCASGSDCFSGKCTTFYVDSDKDGYGGAAKKLCGASPASGHVTNDDDCCDAEEDAFPGQTEYFDAARNGCGGFDYDCSGDETTEYNYTSSCGNQVGGRWICSGWNGFVPACGKPGERAHDCKCSTGEASCSDSASLCPIFGDEIAACR